MESSRGVRFLFVLLCSFIATAGAVGQTPTPPPAPAKTGKAPVIIIPGLTGSELVNSRTGEEVWFKATRSKDDDLRLPISPNLARNRDNLVARDIIRSVKFFKFLPETEIYERLINALETRGGYKEGNWKAPPRDGYQDTFYVFPYDWRRDNVESARLLIRRIEVLKRKLGKRNLKFNVIAHSMGGLVARYAAMYGDANLPAGTPKPTWAGARNFDKIFLLGTPNEGTVSAIDALLNGFSYLGGGLNLPFIQNISRFDVFTIPSMYQLLPHRGALRAFDENLRPLSIDLYDPRNWEKYNWAVWQDDDFGKKLTPLEQRNARAYFRAVLARAKKFQEALDANSNPKVPVSFYLVGADCKDTGGGLLLLRNDKKNRWETRFKAETYTKSNGEKIDAAPLKSLLFAMGDGVVPKYSLSGESDAANAKKAVLPVVDQLYQCELHSKLVTNIDIQDKLLSLLGVGPPKSAEQPK